MRRRLAPLAARPFDRLLTSYTLNEAGDSVGVVALSLLVFDRTGRVAPTAGFFLAAKFLPALLAPGLTARLDHLPVRRVLPVLYAAEALVFAALALISHAGFRLGPVLALGLIDGVLALSARGLTRGAVAAVLQPGGMLRDGNALLNLGFALASVGGTALAGVLVSQIGLSGALLVDAGSFLAIAMLLGATPDLPTAHAGEAGPWRERLLAGLRFARQHEPVRALLVGQSLALVCFTLIVPIEVIYARRTLGTTSAGFGALLSSWSAGILLGSLVYLLVRARSPAASILASTGAVGAAYLGLAVTDSLAVACAVSVVGGIGNGVQWVAVMTALQEATPSEYQSRVSGLMESVGAAVPGIGYLIGGAIVEVSSPRAAYGAAGAGIALLVLLGTVAARPVAARLVSWRS